MPIPRSFLLCVVAGAVSIAGVAACTPARDVVGPPAPTVGGTATTSTALVAATTTTGVPGPAWYSEVAASGRPFPGAAVQGLLTFRGNPTRSWYGSGPVPRAPVELWRYPQGGGMCGTSSEFGETSQWCGTGWTGQPAMWTASGAWSALGARTLVAFGAYDYGVHVLDATTGRPAVSTFRTGDLIKGSVSIDPDGYPLLYTGSRDGYLRIIALDRPEPVELWRFHAEDVQPTMWNDDWDGSPLVVGGLLLQGGENSRFHAFRLQRGYGTDGKVTASATLAFHTAGWDDQLLAESGTPAMSIENSVALAGTTVYFSNSAGLVQGWDLAGLTTATGPTNPSLPRTFRFWMGDDQDASIVVDAEGFLYAAAEYERSTARATAVGQFVKLDPRKPDNPVVWAMPLRTGGVPSGVWATPALHRDIVIVTTNAGEVLGVDRATGAVRWELGVAGPAWSSPVVVDDVLIQGDCGGVLRAWDVRDTRVAPPLLWSIKIGGCIESTPAVWDGRIVVGTRSGQMVAVGDR